jgi:hypothetical protein
LMKRKKPKLKRAKKPARNPNIPLPVKPGADSLLKNELLWITSGAQ